MFKFKRTYELEEKVNQLEQQKRALNQKVDYLLACQQGLLGQVTVKTLSDAYYRDVYLAENRLACIRGSTNMFCNLYLKPNCLPKECSKV